MTSRRKAGLAVISPSCTPHPLERVSPPEGSPLPPRNSRAAVRTGVTDLLRRFPEPNLGIPRYTTLWAAARRLRTDAKAPARFPGRALSKTGGLDQAAALTAPSAGSRST